MELSAPLVLMLSGLAAVSAAVQGLTGIGFALVGMGLASMLVGPRDANMIWTLLAGPVALYMSWRLRRHVHWGMVAWMLAGMAVGLPFGIHVLAVAPASLLNRLIGGVIGVFALYYLFNPPVGRHDVSPLWGIPTGTVSGILAGATNMPGPPVAIFLLTLGFQKDPLRGTLAAYFAAGVLYKIGMLTFWQLLLGPDHVVLAGFLMLPLLGGMAAGMYASRFVSTGMVQKGICVLLIVPALILLVS